MDNNEWMSLIRQLPQEIHNKLVMVLQNRVEVAIDMIFRLQPTCAIFRGRIAGTTESGYLFLVPYDQISNLYVAREMTETEIDELFSPDQARIAAKKARSHHAQPMAEPPPMAPTTPVPLRPSMQGIVMAPQSAVKATVDPTSPQNRQNLLERLRAARGAAGAPATNGT